MDEIAREILERMPGPILWATAAHAIVGIACLLALGANAHPVMGVHPAIKPLKFAISITLFLATMGIVLPGLSIEATTRELFAWLFASTMVAEMLPIVVQALRGTTSHFNVRGPLNAATWTFMFLAIVVASLAMVFVAVIASVRPLVGVDGQDLPPLMATAWRAGLWLLLLSPVSGFAMGRRSGHSVGGVDGGPGLPFVNWSVQHGDLRVAHFFALHAVQVLPLVAWGLLRADFAEGVGLGILVMVIFAVAAVCLGTLAQAFSGRPFLR